MKRKAFITILFFAAGLTAAPSLTAALGKTKPAAQAATPAAGGQEARPQGNTEKPFDEFVKGARKMDGLFPLYIKGDKVYLEILPGQFDKSYLFIPTLWTSVENAGLDNYMPLRVFTWEKLETKVLLLWKNTSVAARKSPEYRRALKNLVPDSIVHSFPIESVPHPERKSFLICLDDCFFSDLQKLGSFSDAAHPYSVDRARTVWGKIMAFPKNIELEVRYTMASPKPAPMTTVPDSSAYTLNVRYSLSELPEDNGYRPRLADDRVGYFMTKILDYDKLDIDGIARHFINRWHLVKKDPSLPLSEPVEPIVFWLENTIPVEYRPALRDGVLEWNKAFEKIGFKNVMVVKEMPDDAEWDPADVRYNTVRWIPSLNGRGGSAMGPSRVNPLTGQILDADVSIQAPMNFLLPYTAISAPFKTPGRGGNFLSGGADPWAADNAAFGMETQFGILDMFASGKIREIGDVPKEYVYESLKHLACHEVGHTLGLRHNFKGSSAIDFKDIHDTDVTSKNPLGNSIMEYLPVNLAPKGTKQGDYFQKTIGSWDYWVIDYGYRPIESENPEGELPELEKIAGRSSEPALVYGTDEDSYNLGPHATSIDPLAMTFDMSGDPLSYAEQSIGRTRDIWKDLENRVLFEGLSYKYLRWSFESSLARYNQAMQQLPKWIGGIYHSRVHVGEAGGEPPFRVVEWEKQKKALDIIKKNLLDSEAFAFDPAFIRKMQFDCLVDPFAVDPAIYGKMNFSLSSYLEQAYRGMLRTLHDPVRLRRIQDNALLTSEKTLTLSAFLEDLHAAVWREVTEGKPVNPNRRILQTEYLSTVVPLVLKKQPLMPDDAVTLLRYELKHLKGRIADYLAGYPGRDLMTRAHLENCSAVIEETLKAGYSINPQ